MAKGGGGGGEKVGTIVVEIVGDATQLAEDVANAKDLEGTEPGAATGGRKGPRDTARPAKDAAPTVTNVDAKVKAKVENQVSKDIQAAIDVTEYEITLNTDSIRQQVELALKRAFDITVNVKTGEGQTAEALANVGTTHGAAVQAGAPIARGAPPPELSQAMPEHTKNAITNVYRNLNELLTKANKPKFGAFATTPGNEVEKALELMDRFGDKMSDMLDVDWSSKRGKTVRGGTMTPEALAEAFGIDPNDDTMTSLQSNLRGLALPAPAGQSPSRGSDVFMAQARAWAGTPAAQVVQPAAAPEQVVKPVVQAAAETAARTVTPDVDERIQQSEEESRKTRQAMSSQAWPSAEDERTAGLRTRPFALPTLKRPGQPDLTYADAAQLTAQPETRTTEELRPLPDDVRNRLTEERNRLWEVAMRTAIGPEQGLSREATKMWEEGGFGGMTPEEQKLNVFGTTEIPTDPYEFDKLFEAIPRVRQIDRQRTEGTYRPGERVMPLRQLDYETELAAQQALGGGERANPRRLSQRVPTQTVAGVPANINPLLSLAAMGRYGRVFEEFSGTGQKAESLGQVQFEEPQSAVELEELNRLRAPSKNPNVRRVSGGRTFTPIKPAAAFREDVIKLLGIGEGTGAGDVSAALEEVDKFLADPAVALEIKKALGVGNNPRMAARSTSTPGGPSAATKRGQGSTGFAGIGTGGELGRDAMSVINWIDDLEGRIATTSDVMARLAEDIERSAGTGQDVSGLEAQHRDLAKNLQKLKRKRTEAIQERGAIFATTTPEDARALAESGRVKGAEMRENVEKGVGLSEAEVGVKEFKSPEKTGSRQADLLRTLGLDDPQTLQTMLRARTLAESSRVRPGTGTNISGAETGKTNVRTATGGVVGTGEVLGGTEQERGRILTGTTAMRETAFGSGKKQEGGIFGELVGRLPEDMGRNAKKEAKQAIRDVLEGVIQQEAEARLTLEEDLSAKEPMMAGRKFMSDVSPEQARRRGYTGEGQFRFAPGIDAASEANIRVNEERGARIAELKKILRPEKITTPAAEPKPGLSPTRVQPQPQTETVFRPDRRFSAENVERMKQELRVLEGEYINPEDIRRQVAESQARQELEGGIGGEADIAETTRAKTQARRPVPTGEESVAFAAGRRATEGGGITMEEPEAPPLPFADITAEYGMGGVASAAGGAGGRPPRGRLPTFDEQEPPEEGGPGFPEGGGGGAINVRVINWPTGLGAGGRAGGPDVRQQEIVGASRQIAELGAQTSAEFQDAFRMEAQRLTQAGMKAADVRKMAEKAGLGSAAAMYYGTAPTAAATEGEEEEEEKPEDRPYGPEFRVLGEDFNVKTTPRTRAAEREARQEDKIPPLVPTAGGTPMRVVNTPQARGMEKQRLEAAALAEEPFAGFSEEAKAREKVQKRQDAANAKAARDQAAADRAQAAELKRMQRQVRVNDPEELAKQRDIEAGQADSDDPDSLRSMRGENRRIQRFVPRRGFGASLTDLVTGIVGRGALEKQLEAADRAQQEIAEMTRASDKRAELTTTQKGVRREIGTARAAAQATAPGTPERRLANERVNALREQDRKLTKDIEAQSAVIKTSTGVFKENSAIVKKNTAAAFGAAAIGSIGSIGIGALTFGLGSAIAAPLIEAMGQGMHALIDRTFGDKSLIAATRTQIGEATRQAGGGAGGVAQVAISAGLAGPTFAREQAGLVDVAQAEAGNRAITDQIGLLKLADEQKDLFTEGTGGILDTGLFGNPSTQEQIGDYLMGPVTSRQRGNAPLSGIGVEKLFSNEEKVAENGDKFIGELDKLQKRMNEMNELLDKENDNLVDIVLGTEFTTEELQQQSRELVAAGAPNLAKLGAKGVGAFVSEETGKLLTGKEVVEGGGEAAEKAAVPSVEALLLEGRHARGVQAEADRAQLRRTVDTTGPQTQALALAARPPTDTRSINLTGAGGSTARLNKDLKETQGLYNQINKEIDAGVEASIDFVTNGADIAGLGNDIGGLGAEAGAEFAASLKLVRDYGQQIANIEIGLETKQAAYQAAQFSYQIGIAKRNLADAKGLAGQITDAGKDNLGVLERQMFFLQRRAQMMQMELSQRQINFQKAVAGFTAPGITPEERNARVQEAKIEADFAQKQLDIQKKLFALQGRGFGITSTRQVRDLEGQLGLLERGRVISLETAAAEKKVKALTILQEKENKKVTAFYEAAIARSNDIISLMANVANAAKQSMADVADAVLDEYEIFVDSLVEDLMNTVPDTNGSEGGGNDETGGGRFAGGNVMAGVTRLVGEQGPELFTPGENGQITPMSMMAGLTPMSTGSSNITNISIMVTGNNVSSEEELAKFEQRIVDAVEKAQGRKLSIMGGRAF